MRNVKWEGYVCNAKVATSRLLACFAGGLKDADDMLKGQKLYQIWTRIKKMYYLSTNRRKSGQAAKN